MIIRAYLGPATVGAVQSHKSVIERFALKKGHRIRDFFFEDESVSVNRPRLLDLLQQKGLHLAVNEPDQAEPRDDHPELFRLLNTSKPGDAVLLPHLNLLESLSDAEWTQLRTSLKERRIRLVTLDVEGSWKLLSLESGAFPMIDAITTTMLDTLETASRKPVKEHRQRQLEGIARAKKKGKFKGRPIDRRKHAAIQSLLEKGFSWSEVCDETGVSRSTIARVVRKSQ